MSIRVNISRSALSTLPLLRTGARLGVRSYFQLEEGGIVIKDIPLRFTTPQALGLVRLSFRPRIFDPFTDLELQRVRLWVEPTFSIQQIQRALEPYQHPAPQAIHVFQVDTRAYELSKARVRVLNMERIGMPDSEGLVRQTNVLPIGLRLAEANPSRFSGLLVNTGNLIVGDYPDRPRILIDTDNLMFYGFDADAATFSPMQFNQSAFIIARVLADALPAKFRYTTRYEHLSEQETKWMDEYEKKRGVPT